MKNIYATILGCALALFAEAAAPPANLAPLFNGESAAWDVGQWTPEMAAVRQEDGRTVLTVKAGQLQFATTDVVKPGTEVEALVRFPQKTGQWLHLNYGVVSTQGMLSAVGVYPEQEFLEFQMYDTGKRSASLKRTLYRTKWINGVSLGWPEDIRKRVEAGIGSLPSLKDRWFQFRFRQYADGVQIYVDDRLYWNDRGATNTSAVGKLTLKLPQGAELARLCSRAIELETAAFERIPLTGYLNASEMNGSRVDWKQSTVKEDGVPFLKPGVNAWQNDHIDLRQSWLASDLADGYEMGNVGAFGGRWTGAFSVNPFRMQVTVPPGRYTAIHLLAACADLPNSIPTITAQFYRPEAGHPAQFVGKAPLFTAKGKSTDSIPVTLENGKPGWLHHVVIPINPGDLAAFDDLSVVEVEFTKETKLYRAYPDPCYLSFHMAGLPSAAQIYAVTFERPKIGIAIKPAKFANVWTAPEQPRYDIVVINSTAKECNVALEMKTTSYDGQEKLVLKQKVRVAAGQSVTASFAPAPKKYGWHSWTVNMKSDRETWAEEGSLVWLHPDTRERGNWDRGKGPLFGYWEWGGGWITPLPVDVFPVTAQAGMETTSDSLSNPNMADAAREVARKLKFTTHKAFGSCDHFFASAAAEKYLKDLTNMSPAEAENVFLTNYVQKSAVKLSDIDQPPFFVNIGGEPSLGLNTYQSFPSYDGEPESEDFKGMTPDQEEMYQRMEKMFVTAAGLIKKYRPEVKALFPHGDVCFFIPFVRRSAEMRRLIDGVALDAPFFDQPPEAQMGQMSMHRIHFAREEFRKAGIPNPWMAYYEGPCLPTRPGGLTPEGCVDLSSRNTLILLGYGVDMQVGGLAPFDCAGEWGEQRYGGGMISPLPRVMPHPWFASVATLTRHVNRCNFDGWVQTGSLSVYAMRFKHYQTGKLVYAAWTLRGKRPVTFTAEPGAEVAMYDAMDNKTVLTVKDGKVTVTVGTAPCYIEGLGASLQIALGTPDHSDAAPATGAVKLADLSTWTISEKRDMDYEECGPMFVRRFPCKMTATSAGKALAIHLEKPEKDHTIMPFYTTLVPAKPVIFHGKASHIGLWVKASSDWGRVVYFLRDAKGERWISVGTKNGWNSDDAPRASAFNFDGWRYVRFEMPACSPYDSFLELGTTWWGSYGNGDGTTARVNPNTVIWDSNGPGQGGDGVVDLPLTLEKIVVERRTHAMYVNDPQPCSTNDVLLGSLYAEYEREADKGEKAVELSRLRMLVPTNAPGMKNPIADLNATGTLPATEILKTTVPMQEADGRRCFVHFTTNAVAVTYDVWASAYENGLGAVHLGTNWKESGGLVAGLKRDTDFYLFVVYTDKNGKKSKPSKPFKINLKDTFGMK